MAFVLFTRSSQRENNPMNWFKSLYSIVSILNWKGIILFLIGICLLLSFIQLSMISFASLHWKTTQGKIITSKAVVCHRRYFPNDYEAQIIYEYSVNNILYSSNNLALATDLPMTYCGNAQGMMRQYPRGMSVLVYYDPENPKNATLRPGGTNFMVIFISLVIVAVGIIVFIRKSNFAKIKIIKRKLEKRTRLMSG